MNTLEWLKKWWFLVLFGISMSGYFVRHEIRHNEIENQLEKMKEDLDQMPKRVMNEWKAYLFEKEMRASKVKRDTTGSNIDINR